MGKVCVSLHYNDKGKDSIVLELIKLENLPPAQPDIKKLFVKILLLPDRDIICRVGIGNFNLSSV